MRKTDNSKFQSLTRRELLANTVLLAGAAIFPKKVQNDEGKTVNNSDQFLQNLIKVLNQQGEFWGGLKEEEIEALHYAYNKIRPENHHELAFIVVCSRPGTQELVDEYCRRKNGEKPWWYDHPVFKLEKWGLPETQRLLVFREQHYTFFDVLTDCGVYKAMRYTKRIFHEKNLHDELFDNLAASYREVLSIQDIKDMLNALLKYNQYQLPFSWCSTMVTRAQEMMI